MAIPVLGKVQKQQPLCLIEASVLYSYSFSLNCVLCFCVQMFYESWFSFVKAYVARFLSLCDFMSNVSLQ